MPLTASDARHLLRRAAYGGLDGEVAALTGLSRAAAVDTVMSTAGYVTADSVPSVTKSSSERRRLAHWWVEQMTTSPAPITERLFYFWHSHFACSSDRVRDQRLMKHQHYALSRRRPRGVPRPAHPYLLRRRDADRPRQRVQRRRRRTGELRPGADGALHHRQRVVQRGRGHLRGPRVDRATTSTPTPIPTSTTFHSDRHDKHDKTLFGITKKWDAQDTIDELVNGVRRDHTAWFLATKLWREFGDPSWASADLITHIADTLKANGMQAPPGDRGDLPTRRVLGARTAARHGEAADPVGRRTPTSHRCATDRESARSALRHDGPPAASCRHRWPAGATTTHGSPACRCSGGPASPATWPVRRRRPASSPGSATWPPTRPSTGSSRASACRTRQPGPATCSTRGTSTRRIRDDLSDTWLEREAFRVGAMLPEVNLA